MPDSMAIHPVLRYGALLSCGAAAVVTCLISYQASPHSLPWLAGTYVSLVVLILAMRRIKDGPLYSAYAFYIATYVLYLLVVWFLVVSVPGIRPAETKRVVSLLTPWLAVGSIVTPVAYFRFALKFAGVAHRLFRGLEAIGWVLTAVFLASNCAGLFLVDYFWAGYTWVPTLSLMYTIFFYSTTFFLTAGCVVPTVCMFMCNERQKRLQLLFFVVGAAPMWASCWSNFLISMGFKLYPIGGMAFIVHAAILAYAVLLHQVYGVRLVIRRGLAYAAVCAALGMLYGMCLWWLPPARDLQSITGVSFILLTGLLTAPVLSLSQTWVDKFFFRYSEDRQELLAWLTREVASTVQLEKVAQTLCAALEHSFHPRSTQIYLCNDALVPILFGTYEAGTFRAARWPNGEPLPEALLSKPADSFEARRITLQRDSEPRPVTLGAGDEMLLVPILQSGLPLGWLVLEGRKADEPYSNDDVLWAQTVAAQSAVALQNARSYAQLQHLQALTTQTLEAQNAGVLLINDAERVMRCNHAARELLNAAGQLVDVTGIERVQPGLAAEIRRSMHARMTRTNEEFRLTGENPQTLLFSSAPMPSSGDMALQLFLLHDITEYKVLEAAARKREELAQIGVLIASINHEVKNILQPIQHQLNSLQELLANNLSAAHSMEVITNRLNALNRLLSNLRDLSRPLELRVRPLELQPLIAGVWSDLRAVSPKTSAELKISIGPGAEHCTADGHWLSQVIFNLLRNALEATQKIERPAIAIDVSRRDASTVICISDNGPGIEPAALKVLFEPFFSTKGEAGTGLGLSISRKVIELHKGTITAGNLAAGGGVFTISLPDRPA